MNWVGPIRHDLHALLGGQEFNNGVSMAGSGKPSLLRVMTHDYSSFVALISPIVVWAMCGLLRPFWNHDDPTIFLWFPIIVTAIMVPLFLWRVWIIWSTLTCGIDVNGIITSIFFFRDRGRVDYSYTFEGKPYRRGNGIMKSRVTLHLEPNTNVILAVNPKNPKLAFIRDIYSST